jgi:hypothetical protein
VFSGGQSRISARSFTLSSDPKTAIDRQLLTGHVTRRIRQQKADDLGDILGLPEPFDRRFEVFHETGDGADDAAAHLGIDKPGTDRIYPDAELAIFDPDASLDTRLPRR